MRDHTRQVPFEAETTTRGQQASLIRNEAASAALSSFSQNHDMILSEHTAATAAHQQEATEGDLYEVNDRYAESILSYNIHVYDALEIHGVRDVLAGRDADGTAFEIDNENPQLFSVYVHAAEGGVDAVGDHSTYALAADYARELSARYQWVIHDYVPNKHRNLKALQ